MLAAVACLTTIGTAALFGANSAAQTSSRPTISGTPAVGSVLTASASTTGRTIYQWQGCDPMVSNCSDSLSFTDPNWSDLTGQSHANTSYTVAPSDAGHFIRVLVHDNTTGDKWTTSAPVGPVPIPPPPPATQTEAQQQQSVEPEHGISLLVEPIQGTVLIRLPGQSGYGPLTALEKIPVNSVLDTRGGTAKVTAATGDLGDTTEDQSIDFFGGLIRVEQAGNPNAPAVGRLIQKLKCKKGGAKASKSSGPLAGASKRRSRRVWGNGSGNYGTAGSGGTGSVRGTLWLTKDTCKGTVFKVPAAQPGAGPHGITVHDFDLNKNLDLGPGQSYFARNR